MQLGGGSLSIEYWRRVARRSPPARRGDDMTPRVSGAPRLRAHTRPAGLGAAANSSSAGNVANVEMKSNPAQPSRQSEKRSAAVHCMLIGAGIDQSAPHTCNLVFAPPEGLWARSEPVIHDGKRVLHSAVGASRGLHPSPLPRREVLPGKNADRPNTQCTARIGLCHEAGARARRWSVRTARG
jgi:hypothetical protein